jgi:exopolyphosphatase/guanosine-5'-triphosphate,3'-diphosphate pyrophosphatase
LRYGAIDIGTNSVRLLVAEKKEKRWHTLRRCVEITRLGRAVDKTQHLDSEAISRTINVVAKFKKILDEYGVTRFKIVATSAARDARNIAEFASLVAERTNCDLEVLTGLEEAKLTFRGAIGASDSVVTGEKVLVVDIGGGSTEFIVGQDCQVIYLSSVDIGSVRLTEKYIKQDPPENHELEEVRSHIRAKIDPVFKEIKEHKPRQIVGVAGTVTTLAAVKQGLKVYDSQKIHGYLLSRQDIEMLLARFRSLKLADRRKLAGLDPRRADVIITGTIIMQEILTGLGFEGVTVSEKDILDGLVFSLIS